MTHGPDSGTRLVPYETGAPIGAGGMGREPSSSLRG